MIVAKIKKTATYKIALPEPIRFPKSDSTFQKEWSYKISCILAPHKQQQRRINYQKKRYEGTDH